MRQPTIMARAIESRRWLLEVWLVENGSFLLFCEELTQLKSWTERSAKRSHASHGMGLAQKMPLQTIHRVPTVVAGTLPSDVPLLLVLTR